MQPKHDGDTRRDLIIEALQERGEVRVSDLAHQFGVSEMTIRRDLEDLEERGGLRRVRGGAISTISRSYNPPFQLRATIGRDEKLRIGKLAASFVEDGDAIVIDAGTTTIPLAEEVSDRRGITVATPSLRIASLLSERAEIRTLLTGGFVTPGEQSLVGEQAEGLFSRYRFDTVFVTCGGVHPEVGITEYNLDDARVKRAILEGAARRVVLADHRKLDHVAFSVVCPPEGFDVLITGSEAEESVVYRLREAGAEVLVA